MFIYTFFYSGITVCIKLLTKKKKKLILKKVIIMILYIARHGESLGNTGEDTGADPILSKKGRTQAALLGERMKRINLDAVFSSPLKRAVETAIATVEI